MKVRNIAAVAAALTLVASPAVAQAERVSAPVSDESEMGRGSGLILAILAVAAVIAGIIILVDNNEDDSISA